VAATAGWHLDSRIAVTDTLRLLDAVCNAFLFAVHLEQDTGGRNPAPQRFLTIIHNILPNTDERHVPARAIPAIAAMFLRDPGCTSFVLAFTQPPTGLTITDALLTNGFFRQVGDYLADTLDITRPCSADVASEVGVLLQNVLELLGKSVPAADALARGSSMRSKRTLFRRIQNALSTAPVPEFVFGTAAMLLLAEMSPAWASAAWAAQVPTELARVWTSTTPRCPSLDAPCVSAISALAAVDDPVILAGIRGSTTMLFGVAAASIGNCNPSVRASAAELLERLFPPTDPLPTGPAVCSALVAAWCSLALP